MRSLGFSYATVKGNTATHFLLSYIQSILYLLILHRETQVAVAI